MASSAVQELKSTMEEFNRACNTLSKLAFQCRDCGYQINADLNGAKSIVKRHDLVAMGRYFCEYPRKEVNRPGAVRFSEKKRQVRNLKPQASSTARPRA